MLIVGKHEKQSRRPPTVEQIPIMVLKKDRKSFQPNAERNHGTIREIRYVEVKGSNYFKAIEHASVI